MQHESINLLYDFFKNTVLGGAVQFDTELLLIFSDLTFTAPIRTISRSSCTFM